MPKSKKIADRFYRMDYMRLTLVDVKKLCQSKFYLNTIFEQMFDAGERHSWGNTGQHLRAYNIIMIINVNIFVPITSL